MGLRVIDLLRSDKKHSDVFLGILVFEQLVGLRKIYEQGGVFTLDLDAPIPIKQLPPLVPLACYAFCEGNTVTFVMPNEMRSLFAGLELGRIQAKSEGDESQFRFQKTG